MHPRLRPGRAAALLVAVAAALVACAPAPPPPSAPAAAGPGLARALERADSLVQAAVAAGVPGAVLLVAKDGAVVRERAFGHAELFNYQGRRLPEPRAMSVSTVFDLASVTKVMATTMAVMLLVDRGRVELDEPVGRYLPDFRGPALDGVTVRHLLSHSSGLVQWQPLYYHASTPAETYAVIRDMPLGWGVGEGRHYSDLGFMLLGYLVERVSGAPLDDFVRRELYDPLGLRATTFRPRERGLTDFAANEPGNVYERRMVHDSTFGYRYEGDPNAWRGWREYVLEGEVDDGNAWYAHGGVAGHAGLFSTAADLRVLLDLLLARGSHGGRRYLRAETVDAFLTRDRYGHHLGWMAPDHLPEGSFAHTGFTGTYVAGVPSLGLSIVLLTNRQNAGPDERGYFPDLAPLQSAVSAALVAGARADEGGAAP